MQKGPFPKLDLSNKQPNKGPAVNEKEEKLKFLRKEFTQNPHKEYRPDSVAYFFNVPEICPYDQEPLLHLKNVQIKGISVHEGRCCLRCSKLFLKNKAKPKPPQEKPKTGTGKEPMSIVTPQSAVNVHTNGKKTGVHFLETDTLPDSTILVAEVECLDQPVTGKIAIVTDTDDQDAQKGIYWVGRSFSSVVLAAIQTDYKHRFDFKAHRYQIVTHTLYSDARKYLDIIARFCNPSEPQIVHVFAYKNLAHFASNQYELVSAMVPCANRKFPVPISVYYDKKKRKYFINEVTYREARKNYGLPYMRISMSEKADGHTAWQLNLNQHSELYLLGYRVNAMDGYTAEARHKLLSQIIDSGLMKKVEIVNHIEWLIKTNEGKDKMTNAVGEWKTDLSFLYKYQVEKQRKIWVEAFASKYSGAKKV